MKAILSFLLLLSFSINICAEGFHGSTLIKAYRFTADHKYTAVGQPIQTLKKGDEVAVETFFREYFGAKNAQEPWSSRPIGSDISSKPIDRHVGIRVKPADNWRNTLKGFFGYASDDEEEIRCSEDQLFYSLDEGTWVPAQELVAGSRLMNSRHKEVFVLEKKIVNEPITVFSFSVKEYPTLFVGKNEVLAHNFGHLVYVIPAVLSALPQIIGGLGIAYVASLHADFIKRVNSREGYDWANPRPCMLLWPFSLWSCPKIFSMYEIAAIEQYELRIQEQNARRRQEYYVAQQKLNERTRALTISTERAKVYDSRENLVQKYKGHSTIPHSAISELFIDPFGQYFLSKDETKIIEYRWTPDAIYLTEILQVDKILRPLENRAKNDADNEDLTFSADHSEKWVDSGDPQDPRWKSEKESDKVAKPTSWLGNSKEAEIERVLSIIKLGERYIGRRGTTTTVREMSGSVNDARSLFEKLASSGKITHTLENGGKVAELANGAGHVTFRPISSSGHPAVDVVLSTASRRVCFKFLP